MTITICSFSSCRSVTRVNRNRNRHRGGGGGLAGGTPPPHYIHPCRADQISRTLPWTPTRRPHPRRQSCRGPPLGHYSLVLPCGRRRVPSPRATASSCSPEGGGGNHRQTPSPRPQRLLPPPREGPQRRRGHPRKASESRPFFIRKRHMPRGPLWRALRSRPPTRGGLWLARAGVGCPPESCGLGAGFGSAGFGVRIGAAARSFGPFVHFRPQPLHQSFRACSRAPRLLSGHPVVALRRSGGEERRKRPVDGACRARCPAPRPLRRPLVDRRRL